MLVDELTASQKVAYEAMMSGMNVFLTGNAGTGKSYLMRKTIAGLQEQQKNVVVTAPTGVAAINIGGSTLHRVFQLKPDVYVGQKPRIPAVLRETDVLVIDEISMCRIDLFEYIGSVLEKVKRRIQVIVVGDFCQLPPVMPRKRTGEGEADEKMIMDDYFGFDIGGGYAFKSPQWARLNFKIVVLQEVVRQDDEQFIRALGFARCGDTRSLRFFSARSSPTLIDGGIYIAGRNAEVDELNQTELDKLKTPLFTFNAKSTGQVSAEDKRVAPERLDLKVGTRIMMTTNDPDGAFVNGSLGWVTDLNKRGITVQIDDAEGECKVKIHSWEIVRYEVNKEAGSTSQKFKRTVIGVYKQYPIKLAYAVTVHKSQGQTFTKVNLNPNCWDSGQLYVALSRVKTVEGLHLTSPLKEWYLRLDPDVYEFYAVTAKEVRENEGWALGSPKTGAEQKPRQRAAGNSVDGQMSMF